MNETVSKLVEIAFRDTQRTEEVQTLYEQVLMDCQERFLDMTRNGIDEDEAIAAVVESLRGMEEVLREFPRKPSEPESWRTVPEESHQNTIEVPCMNIRKINITVRNHDIHVQASGDDHVHMRTVAEKIHFRADESEIYAEEEQEENPLQGLARLLSRIGQGNGSQEPLYLEIPGGTRMDYQLQTESGDIYWEGTDAGVLSVSTAAGDTYIQNLPCTLEMLQIRSSSGDIALSGSARIMELSVHTASGDIRGALSGAKCDAHTISGDVKFTGNGRDIQLDTLSGDLELEGIFSAVHAKTMSGEIEMSLEAEEVSVNSTSGDIRLRGEYGKVSMHSTSGDASLKGAVKECCGESTSGDVNIDVRRSENLRRIEAGSKSGDLSICLPVNGQYALEMHTVSGEIVSDVLRASDANAAPAITARTISGDIRVH